MVAEARRMNLLLALVGVLLEVCFGYVLLLVRKLGLLLGVVREWFRL
jgi:hypothetical protein